MSKLADELEARLERDEAQYHRATDLEVCHRRTIEYAIAALRSEAQPVAEVVDGVLTVSRLPKGYTGSLYAHPQPVPEVTDAMVDAYLKANTEYWHLRDADPYNKAFHGVTENPVKDATRRSLKAALAVAQPVPEGWKLVRADVVDFLRGAGELDGKWYEEADESGAPYWWRKYLYDLPKAAAPGEPK